MSMGRFVEQMAFSPLVKPLIRLTGNRWAQDALDGVHHICQHLMGIGSGTGCNDSGEEVAFRVLKEAMEPPYTVFDVGANVGAFVRLAEKCLQPHAFVVHAFEPASDSFGALQAAFGGREGYVLNKVAVGSAEGEGTLYSDQPLSGLASLTRRNLDHEGRTFDRTETVRIVTLDEYCRTRRVAATNLLKIDVEGHDLDVMKGARALFDERAIGIATFEFGSAQIDTRVYFRDLYHLMRAHGMQVFRITRSGYLYHIPTYHERHEQFWTTNFLSIRDDLCSLSRTASSSMRP